MTLSQISLLKKCFCCNLFCILSAVAKADWQIFCFRWLERVKCWSKNIHHFSVPYKHVCECPLCCSLPQRQEIVCTFLERSYTNDPLYCFPLNTMDFICFIDHYLELLVFNVMEQDITNAWIIFGYLSSSSIRAINTINVVWFAKNEYLASYSFKQHYI